MPAEWKMWALPIAVSVWLYGTVKLFQSYGAMLGKENTIVPIYGEDNKLKGFTHPALVQHANERREREV